MGEIRQANGVSYITYGELKKFQIEQIPIGTILTGVKPRDLYTVQTWIDTKKVLADLNSEVSPDLVLPTIGYLHKGRIGGIKLILGDGNTKSIVALVRGHTVQFEVKGLLPPNTRYRPLIHLYQDNADLFTGF
ncbi:hypothetical protein A2866_00300 [Candidatus Roizmanbacteria bacterium RIFCSPHIGHO2_01_FULL_39_8]|uniref:Uncharacterized protein n=2 Tax=Candidatus Roizmaniibacteriota TaxID=1752723 RepID=A0A1F7GJC4_9BACT|nr:MAG: hypothetical protein A2866_00300 [Candidatus Roizmanbacteria bacterium RIFCSPHIGHO2_01_FULL_39_8]OGK27801.1 MAG: hypothetical protein A3C28_02600 [Candidatus Roizmanbacteria bacterium RIFCSPHIGHO2_02_FULL_39_9]